MEVIGSLFRHLKIFWMTCQPLLEEESIIFKEQPLPTPSSPPLSVVYSLGNDIICTTSSK